MSKYNVSFGVERSKERSHSGSRTSYLPIARRISYPLRHGIPPLVTADQLAKVGSHEGLPSNLLPSARELIAIINQKAYNEQDHRCHKINIYSPIKREDRAYTRLRLRVSRLHGDYYKPVNCPQWVIAAYKNRLIINRDSLLMPPSGIAPVVRLHVFKFLRDTGYLDKI
ncbi:hypothetical protein DPMN_109294 [Dreissena polymorpha]|uniref:Uncharacterized protein n=1 Tax=Dreissena polymorpha TaxID=45954 RepID=A0A9D4KA11_DREPO|nr:hypothetical protein DPMN_109294 [Dreissena polymorpha]